MAALIPRYGFQEMIVRYLAAAAGQLNEDTLRSALRKALPLHIEETIMPTIAETWEARGEARETIQRSRQILLRQLTQRFGSLSDDRAQQIEAADLATLDAYLDRVLVATQLDEIFEER